MTIDTRAAIQAALERAVEDLDFLANQFTYGGDGAVDHVDLTFEMRSLSDSLSMILNRWEPDAGTHGIPASVESARLAAAQLATQLYSIDHTVTQNRERQGR